jgi:hypothetical protein
MKAVARFIQRFLMLIGLMTVLAVLGLVFGYLLPKNVGDRFTESLKVLDTAGLQATVCPNSGVGSTIRDVRDGGDEVGRIWREVTGVPLRIDLGTADDSPLYIEASYDALSSIYTFRYRFRENTGVLRNVELPQVELYIERSNLFNPCVQVA